MAVTLFPQVTNMKRLFSHPKIEEAQMNFSRQLIEGHILNKSKLKDTNYVDTAMSNVLRNSPFSRNQPLKSSYD